MVGIYLETSPYKVLGIRIRPLFVPQATAISDDALDTLIVFILLLYTVIQKKCANFGGL